MTIPIQEELPLEQVEAPFTHNAIITLSSNGDEDMIQVSVKWEPDIEGKTIEEIGFLPASYQFVQQYMLPAIEQGYTDWAVNPMIKLDPPSNRRN